MLAALAYHPDHLGSAQVGTLKSTGSGPGEIAWREQYTPFGAEIVGNAANDNQAGFTGHIKDKATGLSRCIFRQRKLHEMQASYYDPVIGRFLSIDPVTFMDTGVTAQFNRYSYTANDPINWTDPNGECPWCVVLAVIYVADKAYGAYDAAQTAKGIANGTIDPVDAAVSQGSSQLGGLIAGPVGRQVGKKVPNPFGKKGGPKHQQKTQDVVDDIESRGLIVKQN